MKPCPQCGFEFEPVKYGGWEFVRGRLKQAPRVEWSAQEARLIIALLRAGGAVLSQKDLVDKVTSRKVKPGLIDVLVHRIRKKGPRDFIGSVYGQGHLVLRRAP